MRHIDVDAIRSAPPEVALEALLVSVERLRLTALEAVDTWLAVGGDEAQVQAFFQAENATHEAELEERGEGEERRMSKREGSTNDGLEKRANSVSDKVLAAKSKRGQDMSTGPELLPEEIPGGEIYEEGDDES